MARRKTGTVLSVDPDEARQQILTAAEVVFQQYGVGKTTMDDIARGAGVARPTIYRYFADRDSLIAALIQRRARLLFVKARGFIDQFPTFAEQLVEGIIYLVDHGRRDPIIRILVSPEHMQMAEPLIGSAGVAARLTAELWTPIVDAARERGEVQAHLTTEKVAEWITLLQFILVGRLDFARADDPGHRNLLWDFVVPAFSCASAQPGAGVARP